MRVVVALGGNALLRRGEAMTSENQRQNVRKACTELAPVAGQHELVIAHGNGPQVGLRFQAPPTSTAPARHPGCETQGMIGYLVEQELGNLVPFDKPLATLLTMIEVDIADPAFEEPSKPIGPIYERATAEALAAEKGWTVKPEATTTGGRALPSRSASSSCARLSGCSRGHRRHLRRARHPRDVASTGPATDSGPDRQLVGVEAVIDKDHASGLLATGIEADYFIMATDADAAYSTGKPARPSPGPPMPGGHRRVRRRVDAAVSCLRVRAERIGAIGGSRISQRC
jgi:carbamate kinase